jgi:hypothetical protein
LVTEDRKSWGFEQLDKKRPVVKFKFQAANSKAETLEAIFCNSHLIAKSTTEGPSYLFLTFASLLALTPLSTRVCHVISELLGL